jgi:hypothetical protein
MAVSSRRLKLNLGDPFDALLHEKKRPKDNTCTGILILSLEPN